MDNSFENVSALWLEDNKLFWKESTYTKYLFISKNVDKIICDCSLEKINSKIVQQTVNQILICNAMSITTIKAYISVINSVLSFAYDNDYNCVEHIKITFPKKQKNELKILTQKEQKLLTAYLTKNIDLTKLAVLFALYTGIRCGELCAIKWSDIDLFNGVVSINKTMQRVQCDDKNCKTKIIVTPPKTTNSNRMIPIPKFLVSILKSFNPKNENAYLLTGLLNTVFLPVLVTVRLGLQMYTKPLQVQEVRLTVPYVLQICGQYQATFLKFLSAQLFTDIHQANTVMSVSISATVWSLTISVK